MNICEFFLRFIFTSFVCKLQIFIYLFHLSLSHYRWQPRVASELAPISRLKLVCGNVLNYYLSIECISGKYSHVPIVSSRTQTNATQTHKNRNKNKFHRINMRHSNAIAYAHVNRISIHVSLCSILIFSLLHCVHRLSSSHVYSLSLVNFVRIYGGDARKREAKNCICFGVDYHWYL